VTTRIDAIEARELIAQGVPFIDVLPASIFADEHLPGAVNVPLETFQPSALDDHARSDPLVVYCFDQH
jgi:rhodanese-related sulfurtransferase